MALQNSDLFVVQQGGSVYKVTADQVSTRVLDNLNDTHLPIATATELGAIKVGTNLKIDPNSGVLEAVLPAAVEFKGTIDPTQPAPAAQPGHAYIVNADGVFDATFQNIAGQQGNVGDVCIFEGTPSNEWDLVSGLFGLGVLSITGVDPISVDSSDANNPVIRIAAADDSGQDGTMSSADKAKLDAITPGADIGTVTEVTASLPLHVTDATNKPDISIDAATTAAVGVVRLADSTAIATGTAGRVVDASQLKVVSDDLATLDLKVDNLSLYTFLGDDPIEVNVDASDNVTYSIKDATSSQKGAVRFAEDSEVSTPAGGVAITPALVDAYYVPKDFASLNALP